MENSTKFIATALAMFPLLGVSWALGKVYSSAMDAVARNPTCRDDVRFLSIIGAGLIEAGGLFCLIVALLILAK